MLRSARLVTMVLIAMLIVAVPTAVAQTPAGDQYALPSNSSAAPSAAGGGGGAAPVQVRELTADKAGKLPFTGGQISLVALLGLALLAVGSVGVAASRRRASAVTT
jgi:hypothetical protein